jgi:hypothetical protein
VGRYPRGGPPRPKTALAPYKITPGG